MQLFPEKFNSFPADPLRFYRPLLPDHGSDHRAVRARGERDGEKQSVGSIFVGMECLVLLEACMRR